MTSEPSRVGQPQWDGALYADNTAHHRQFDATVLEGVRLAPDARVLDVGCGAGDFTRRLATLVPDGAVLGVDADPDMIRVAAEGDPVANVDFRAVQAQELADAVPADSCDAVVSVATLHWVPEADHAGVLAAIARILRPGGLFRADFGGAGQIAATREILDEEARASGATAPTRWFFPEPAAYRALLTAAGLRVDGGWVRLLRQRRSMPDAGALRGWLRSQIPLAYDTVVPADRLAQFRVSAESRVLAETRRADGTFDQEYVRMDLLAFR